MKVTMLTELPRCRGLWLFALFAAVALTLSGCDLVGTDDDEQAQQQAQEQEGQQEQEEAQQEFPAVATPVDQPAPPSQKAIAPSPPPLAKGGGDGERAYSIIFPSVARVTVGDAVATGLVTSQGYVLVDGAVLNGAGDADVLLSTGETIETLPVFGYERLTGIVYLGPLDAVLVRLLPGARLGDGEGMRPGSSVFSVGYGALDDADMGPSIYSGVVSGFDEWAPGERTILRTDIALSQTTGGMVLVDAGGTVIGVAPASVAGAGWYISTGDLARSLNAMSAEVTTAGGRVPVPVMTATEHTLTLSGGQSSATLHLADDATSQRVLLTVRTETLSSLHFFDADGALLQEANLVSGATIVALAAESRGPYEIVISPEAEALDEPLSYEVNSNVPLTVVTEAEDGVPVYVDAPFVGAIDIAGDVDTFNVSVHGGAVYEILVQSFLIDPYLVVAGAGIAEVVDDDSGGGLFSLDSALTIEPLADGVLGLSVSDHSGQRSGSYLLTVTQVGGPPQPEQEAVTEHEEDGMMAAAMLPAPAPPPTISLRGIGDEGGLRATLLGLGSESVGDGLLVQDQDGAFEVIVSVLGRDGALGRVTVTNIEGDLVLEGRVLVSCSGSGQCLAQAVFVSRGGSVGPWVVELDADELGIAEWQIEVERGD